MAAMENETWIENDDGVRAYRARARNLLPQITQEVKSALDEASIEIDVFMVIPTTGDAICTFGTAIDPPDEVWGKVGEIVCSVFQRVIGLGRVRCRPLACATTADLSDQVTSLAELTAKPIPIPTSVPSLATEGESQ
jgi:hypothetical protein